MAHSTARGVGRGEGVGRGNERERVSAHTSALIHTTKFIRPIIFPLILSCPHPRYRLS